MAIERVIDAVRRYFWLVVVTTALAAGGAFLVSTALPKAYESEARVLVGSLTETSTDQLGAYVQLAQTYAEIATSVPVLDRVIAKLGLTETAQDLARRVEVRTPAGQPILRIKATSSTAAGAVQVANAIADEITNVARPADASTSLATVYQPGTNPVAPASPRVLLNTIIAAALGLALGIGLAVLLDRRAVRKDVGVRQADEEGAPA